VSRKLNDLGALAPELLSRARMPSVVIGRLVGVADDGYPLVDFAGCGHAPIAAKYVIPLSSEEMVAMAAAHQDVLLVFEEDDAARPIITGALQTPGEPKVKRGVIIEEGGRIRIEGKEEIVLCCGEASITLRKHGRVISRGTHLESDSLGANWIRGVDIQLG
jgi:hypothetical protein